MLITQPSLCGPTTGSIEICSPVSGYTYTQIGGSSFTANGQPVKFSNLAAGSNPSFTVTNNGCTSGPADCSGAATTCPQPLARTTQNTSNSANVQAAVQPQANAIKFDDPTQETTIKAYPNPFSDKVKFVVTSTVSGIGNLDIYNGMGQKIKTVYAGLITAGTHAYELSLPVKQGGNLLYILRIGDKKMSGKLVQLNK